MEKNHWAKSEYFSVVFQNSKTKQNKNLLKQRMGSIARDGFEVKVSAPESHLSGKDKVYMWIQPHPLANPLCSSIQMALHSGQLFFHP